ncbi:MFS family permease [Saccharothrix tamanrassetensis]|uniref:MFS family permease n=1 Tax=Saccharothrix tamanrassetensis TaxID=1051531 RepID=A0A841CG87_9PSEU|nr:MFS transporter [Saccharothrix tamanrassetensis]MBB5956010.1 MFS family permease [Saccharothrix tamanrassetensis]
MNRRILVLTAVLLSSLSFPLTITGASVALPGLAGDLDASLTGAQWVVTGYNLCFAAFLAFGGSLADLLGRRRLYVAGVVAFLVGSVLCAVAGNIGVLIAARLLAGVGAAVATATGQSLLAAAFDGQARARVFGALGTILGIGLACGPTVSGFLVDVVGWRAVFGVPAVLAGLVLLLCPALPAVPGVGDKAVDWSGGSLFTVGLGALIWVFVEAPVLGLFHPVVLGAVLLAVASAVGFVRVERRRRAPMFDLALLGDRAFLGYSLVAAAMMGLLVPLLVYLPSYFIDVIGLDAAQAGLWMLMLTLPSVLLPGVGAAVSRRSPRLLSIGAILVSTVGVVALVTIGPAATPWTLLGPLLLIGTGIGVTTGVVDGLAISSAPTAQAGTAAGLFNTARLATETVTLATVGSALAFLSGGHLVGDGFTDALRTVVLALGCFGVVAAGGANLLLRQKVDATAPHRRSR